MKKKSLALLCGLATATIATSLVVAVMGNKGNISSLFNPLIHKNNGPLNTFVINDGTSFTQYGSGESAYYEALALSSNENTITTKFVGFDKDDVSGKLVVPAGKRAYLTNTTPMNRGFSSFNAVLNSLTYSNTIALVYFSYHSLTLENIRDGQYADLVTAYVENRSSSVFNETVSSSQFPSMENCRYVLAVIAPESDFILQGVQFETPCIATVPEVPEEAYSNWKSSEENFMLDGFGEVVPFVGSGSYFVDSRYGYIDGAFLSSAKQDAYLDDLVDTSIGGFTNTYSVDEDGSITKLYQKKVADVVRTIIFTFHGNDIYSYQMQLTTSMSWMEDLTTWPAQLITDTFSSSFATLLNSHPFEHSGIHYQSISMSEYGMNIVSIILTGFDVAEYLDDAKLIVGWLNNLADASEDYSIGSGSELPDSGDMPEYYDYSINDTFGLSQVGFMYSNGTFGIMIMEQDLINDFPTAAINSYLGLESPDSVIEYTGTGSFLYSDNGNVSVYHSDLANLQSYGAALITAGYTLADSGENYEIYTRSIFDSFTVQLSWYSLASNGYFTINFNKDGASDMERFGSWNAALNAFAESELITGHEYPELTGSHTYLVNIWSEDKKGIYVSGLDSGYISELLEDGEYDAYSDSYIFSNEHDEDNNYFGVNAYLIDGGVRIVPKVVHINSEDVLMDSVDANAALENNFEEYFSDPKGGGEATAYLNARVDLPNSNGEKIYKVDSLTVYIYGPDRETIAGYYDTAITGEGYVYSALQKMYHLSGINLKIEYKNNCTNEYGVNYHQFAYHQSGQTYMDFSSYDDADLTDLETSFAAFPHSGSEKIFLHVNDTVILDSSFNNELFLESLEANGFSNNYGETFVKASGTNYYTVTSEHYYYDGTGMYINASERGFYIYTFTVQNDYFVKYSDALTTSVREEFNATFDSLIPTIDSDVTAFHLNYCDSNSLNLYISGAYSTDDFVDALLALNYTKQSESGNRYQFIDEDYYVYCYVNLEPGITNIDFSFTEFNWSPIPDYRDNINSAYFLSHNYMPLPDDSGNVYSAESYSFSDSFSFKLKKSIDLEAYVNKLVTFGYLFETNTAGLKTLRYSDGDNSLSCNISDYGAYYYVSFYDSSSKEGSPIRTVSFEDIDYYLNKNWHAGIEILSDSFNVSASRCRVSNSDENYIEIEITSDSSSINSLIETLADTGSGYIDRSLGDEYIRYEKTTSSYIYRINTSGDYITISISVNTGE